MLVRAAAYLAAATGLEPAPSHHVSLILQIVADPEEFRNEAAHTAHDGTVTLFLASIENSRRVILHELGHVVWFLVGTRLPNFSTNWLNAVRDDNAAVSVYGTTNELEDFAEAYLMYIVNRSACVNQFPHRAAILAPLVNPPPAVQQPPTTRP